MKGVIERLKSLNLESEPVSDIEEIISSLGFLPAAIYDFHKGKTIHRARCISGVEDIIDASQLSYTSPEFNTRYQRASTPEQTMFYGAVIPIFEDKRLIERLVGACEVSELLRNPNAPDGEEIIVFGQWVVKEKISLLSIINSEIESNSINFFKEMTAGYHAFLNQYPNIKENAKLFQSYMSYEFAKSEIRGDFDYLITAKFTEQIIKNCDGVVYPSVRAEYNGLCVAISPEIVDKHMELVGVLECRITKVGNDVNIENLRFTDEVVDGKFELKDCN